MSVDATGKSSRIEVVREALRGVRQRYDALDRGKTAPLRRCRDAGEVELESVYWRIGDRFAHEQRHLSHVVLLFPLATHVTLPRFSFGRWLRTQLSDRESAAMRVRRLLASRDRGELDHQLRGLLRLAGGDNASIDWGVFGTDILWFFGRSDAVRRRWAQHFYAPTNDYDTTL